jgi:hypothetical protein
MELFGEQSVGVIMKDDRQRLLQENLQELTRKAKDSPAFAELARTLERCAARMGLNVEKSA